MRSFHSLKGWWKIWIYQPYSSPTLHRRYRWISFLPPLNHFLFLVNNICLSHHLASSRLSSSCCYTLACNVVPFFSVSICCPNSIILGWGIMGCNLYSGPQLTPLLTQEILCVVPFLLQTQLTEFRSFEGQEMSTEERVQTIRVCLLYNWHKAFRYHATFFCCLLHDSVVHHRMWWKILYVGLSILSCCLTWLDFHSWTSE
jgi:hypothetical protein